MCNINVIERLNKMSPRAKMFCSVYLAGATTYQLVSTYNAGKSALLHLRSQNTRVTPDEEWKMVAEACGENQFCRFLNAITWPASLASHVVPKVVITLNQ